MNYKELQTVKYQSFERDYDIHSQGQKRFIDNIFEEGDKNKKILDIACGDGVGLRHLKTKGFTDIIGVEFNENKAKIAKESGFQILDLDFHDLKSLGHETFDIVYSSHSLEHAHSPLIVLEQFYNVLKPEGKLILLVPFPDKGPLDCHCGSVILKTRTSDSGIGFIGVVESKGFKLVVKKFDRVREPEIWTIFQKI